MKLTELQKFKILQFSSGHMLTEKYPDNWEELEYKQQHEFADENAWSAMAFELHASEVIDVIDDMAGCTINFIEKEL
ncbi:MAG: hypothetical protein GQ468_02885 [Candidatus Scalindua sp.]|nr:hypothetical protein [Candidatus Scalindua sp.]